MDAALSPPRVSGRADRSADWTTWGSPKVKTYPTAKIRNVALVGHGGSGKTTLVEALLARAGAIPRIGRVEDGTTVSDTEPEEQKRKISISLALAPFEWEGHKINLIDTPGLRRLHRRGRGGPQRRRSRRVRRQRGRRRRGADRRRSGGGARPLGIPRMVFINKEDKERADFHRVLEQLRSTFGSGFAPLELPIGEESAFHGVADVLSDQAFEYEPDGRHHSQPLPSDLEDEEHQVHDELVEEIVSGDDEQLERYLSGEVPSIEELEQTLAHEVPGGQGVPRGRRLGAHRRRHRPPGRLHLRDRAVAGRPAGRRPSRRPGGPGDRRRRRPAARLRLQDDRRPLRRPAVAVQGAVRHHQGRRPPREPSTGSDERLHGLFHLRGKEQTPAPSVVAGDIAAVAKLAATHTGDTLAPKGTPVRVPAAPPPPPAALDRRHAPHPGRRRQARRRAAAAAGRGSGARRGAQRRDAPDPAAGRRRDAPVRVARAAGPQVRRERRHRGGAGALPGDDHGQRRGRGQGQEADRRPRPVRRGLPPRRTGRPRRGLRVRRLDRRRRHPPPVHPGGAEGHRGDDGQRGRPRLPGRRREGASASTASTTRVDSSEMAFKTAASLGFKDAMAKAGVVVLEPVSLLDGHACPPPTRAT